MTTAPTTAPAQGTEETKDAGHVDVLIVGAGVSGIGAAHHLRDKFPDRTFVILDAQDNRGGTWWAHQDPGGRSDRDLLTHGHRPTPPRAARSQSFPPRSLGPAPGRRPSATSAASPWPRGRPTAAGAPSRAPR